MPRTDLPPRPRRRLLWLGAALLAPALLWLLASHAKAQFSALGSAKDAPISRNQPVYYQADTAEYDRDNALVTLGGHVEMWQGERVLRADKVTYDRNTGVAAATGHVVLLEPNGEVLFSDYAELGDAMKSGVLTNIRSQLAENGKLAANGARRTDARVNELSRVIYTTCNLCAQHPDQAPLWDIRARSALQDVDNKRLEYRDAVLDMFGYPIAYAPYFTTPDPSQKRASGLLIPSIGQAKYLGAFVAVPYYWAIDGQSDATITPMITTNTSPQLDLEYRHRFNNGLVTIDGSTAYLESKIQGQIYSKGNFTLDDEWRWGFDINYASSVDYLRDFKIRGGVPDLLSSQVYLEGFGQGSYSRLDTRFYQGLSSSIVSANIPFVLPRYEYSFVGEPDPLGGRLDVEAGAFNVLRQVGTNTQRASLSLNWERPATGALGDLWKLVLHVDSAAYEAQQLNQQPSWGPESGATSDQAMPSAALELRWPLQRTTEGSGTMILEPIAQLVMAPNGSNYGLSQAANGVLYVNSKIPNEDSLDYNFTDATLFSLNRFAGIDRLEGGMRANVALHGAWWFGNQQLDALVGQGYRVKKDDAFPVGSGLEGTTTDVVSHLSYTPNQYFDFTSRQRFDHRNFDVRYVDAMASTGPSYLRLSAGYIFTNDNLYNYYEQTPSSSLPNTPRNEISLGANSTYGQWKLHASVRDDLATGQLVSIGAGGSWENECLIFSVLFDRRYTSVDGDNGATTMLLQVTFKTVGTFGYHSL
jgi:LPS-assembly protein